MEATQVAVDVVEGVSARQRVTLLAATVGGHAVKHMFNSAFFVLLPEIKSGLGMTNVQVGSLSTIRSILGGFANGPAGFVADRFSRQRAETLGLTMAAIGVFALVLGLAGSYWMAVVGAALMTMSITFWHPAAISSLSRQFAARRGLAIALHGTGGSVGEAVGPLLVGFLLLSFTWRVILQGSIVPALIIGAAVWLLLRTVPADRGSVSGVGAYMRSVVHLLGNRRLLLVLLFAGGFAGGQSTALTFLPIYLREEVGVSSVTLGLYLSLAQVAGIISQPVMGYLSDRLGRRVVLVPGLGLLGVTLLGLYLVPAGWPLVLVIIAMGAFLFPMMSVLLASAMDVVEAGVQATTVSLVFGSAVVVSSVSPAVAGALADAFGVTVAFLLASGIVLAAALLAAVTRWQRRAA